MALFGYGIVAVATGGTPVNLADAILGDARQPGQPVLVQGVRIQAHPDNTGVVYVFGAMTNPASDQRTEGAGLCSILIAPTDPVTGPFAVFEASQPNGFASINLANIWIDVGQNGDSVIVSATVG